MRQDTGEELSSELVHAQAARTWPGPSGIPTPSWER